MIVLGVDPGLKRIGIAISDESGTFARALTVIRHVGRIIDAAAIAGIAQEHNAGLIVIGQSFDEDGNLSPQGKHSAKFADAIRQQTSIPVTFWDESFSTVTAREQRIQMGITRKNRQGHLDDVAAAVILQSFLDDQIPTARSVE